MSTKTGKKNRLLIIGLPPLLLAFAGFFHPHQLTTETSKQWTNIHIILLPLFPLLGISYYILFSKYKGPLITIAKIFIGIYIIFYPALDLVAGIANGVVVSRMTTIQNLNLRAELIKNLRQGLYIMGNEIGMIGAYSLLAAIFFTYVHLAGKKPNLATTLSLIGIVIGTGFFAVYHIYAPWGVLGMYILTGSMLSLEKFSNILNSKK